MKFVICIKPVLASLVFEKNNDIKSKYVINPYDLHLINQIEKLKKRHSIHCIALCMGAMSSNEIFTKLFGLGIDEGILLSDIGFAGSDTYATTYILAKAIQKIGQVDYVICGEKSIDGETGQVPYELAQRLNYNVINGVKTIKNLENNYLYVERILGEFLQEELIPSHSIIVGETFSTHNYEFSFLQLKKARSKNYECWNLNDLDLDVSSCGMLGSKTKVIECRKVNRLRASKRISEDIEDIADELHTMIKNLETKH